MARLYAILTLIILQLSCGKVVVELECYMIWYDEILIIARLITYLVSNNYKNINTYNTLSKSLSHMVDSYYNKFKK